MSRKHEDATTQVPPPPPPNSSPAIPPPPPPKAARLYPVLSLLSVVFLLLSAGAGITLSAVVLFRSLESTEYLDPLSRAVFFVASCVSLVYVFTHLIASRTTYIKKHRSPRAYGKYVAGLAFLLARLGLLVWVTAVTLAIFVAVNVGLDVSKGVEQNIPWLNVIISVVSLTSLIAVLAVIEMADRPFATIGFSQRWFVRGEDPLTSTGEDDLEPGLVEVVSMVKDKPSPLPVKDRCMKSSARAKKPRMVLSTIHEQKEKRHSKPKKLVKRKRKTLQKKNPHEVQQLRVLRRARSMSMPTPLSTVFVDHGEPRLPGSPASQAAFAWKPPTREGTPRATGAVTFEDLGAWRDRVSLRHTASDISTNASAPSEDVILPSMPRRVEYSPRSRALILDRRRKYDVRRWTAIGMQSPPCDGGFADLSFMRPPTPLMTMQDEQRLLGRKPLIRDGDWEASYHLRMTQSSRPTSSHTSRTSRTSTTFRTVYAISDEPPLLPPIVHISPLSSNPNMLSSARANSIRPDSDVLPSEGRRRRGLSYVSSRRRLTYGTDSRALSQTYRPSSRSPSSVPSQEQRSPSPTSTARSDVHNFSRPRTSAAARMQAKVAKRLRAMKLQQTIQVQADDRSVSSSSTSPATPRTVRAAALRTLQGRLGRRNQPQPLPDDDRSPSPETPRTARATAVRTMQEKLGRRMMRRNGGEAAAQAQLA